MYNGCRLRSKRKFRPLTRTAVLLLILGVVEFTGCGTQTLPVLKNRTAYVADLTQNSLLAYNVDNTTGALTPLPGPPIAANCNGPRAFAATPTQQFAYVLCENSNMFSGFAINPQTGALTLVGTFTTSNNPVAAAIDPSGKLLYVANSGSNNITGYSIDSNTGMVTPIASATVTTNFAPNGLTIDPHGAFLYASTQFGNNGDVEGFSINPSTGALTVTAGSPFASFISTGIKVHSSGKYVYSSDIVNGVRVFSMNVLTGALAEIVGSPFPAGNEPFGIAFDPLGQFLYTANFVSNDVSGYTIDPITGKLAPVPGSPFAVGNSPAKAVVDTMGEFVYVPDAFDNTVRGFTINGTTGVLTAMPGSPFAATGAEDVLTIPQKLS